MMGLKHTQTKQILISLSLLQQKSLIKPSILYRIDVANELILYY